MIPILDHAAKALYALRPLRDPVFGMDEDATVYVPVPWDKLDAGIRHAFRGVVLVGAAAIAALVLA